MTEQADLDSNREPLPEQGDGEQPYQWIEQSLEARGEYILLQGVKALRAAWLFEKREHQEQKRLRKQERCRGFQ